MIFRTLLLSAVLTASAAAATPAIAQQSLWGAVQPNWVMPIQGRERPENIRSLREVVDEIRSQYGGDLISARLEDGPRPFYVLRWRMPDGQVRDFRVDAAR